MIYLGYINNDKRQIIADYCAANGLTHVVVISPRQFQLVIDGADNVEYDEVIMYRTFYRLLQQIDGNTLIVLDEVLRTQNRYDLTYNCIRNFLNQTKHQLVFQQLPLIAERDDFMILFDFVTRSRWKRQKFDTGLVLDNTQVMIRPLPITFSRIAIPTSAATKKRYAKERARRFATIGARDPHTIPRNLYLIGGKDKLAYIDAKEQPQLSLFADTAVSRLYVARNQRLKRDNIVSYAQAEESVRYTIVEFPHRFIDFSDFVKRTGQLGGDVLVADLKVDEWYYGRYTAWSERIHETYSSLQ